jgi:hypothetical protein
MASDGKKTTTFKRVWRGAIDQCGHWLWAASVVSAVIVIPWDGVNGGVAGLLIALPRELVDQWPIDRWWDTVLDTSFFVIGGTVVSLLL